MKLQLCLDTSLCLATHTCHVLSLGHRLLLANNSVAIRSSAGLGIIWLHLDWCEASWQAGKLAEFVRAQACPRFVVTAAATVL